MAKKKPAERTAKPVEPTTSHDVTHAGSPRELPRRELSEGEFRGRVARKAYELFERRGGEVGHDLEDWLQAERFVHEQINSEIGGKKDPKSGLARNEPIGDQAGRTSRDHHARADLHKGDTTR